METYVAKESRYSDMIYRKCGNSGLKLPAVSLGLWHNFGAITPFETQQAMLRTAFDNGITHFDLANNYGPPYGEAERNFGVHMDRDWKPYRDELILSSKAGFDMWDGPYGIGGSKKYLISSIDQSLKRMHVDYVDIFYHHVPDDSTPLEETAEALEQIVRSGKALYVGISNYRNEKARQIIEELESRRIHCLIEQPNYSIFDRWLEEGTLDILKDKGVGCIAFAPLEHGILTNRYLNGIPSDSRAAHDPRYLKSSDIKPELIEIVKQLNALAENRGQSLAQMALSWVLRWDTVTSVLIGASRPQQILDNIGCLKNLTFTQDELDTIDMLSKKAKEIR